MAAVLCALAAVACVGISYRYAARAGADRGGERTQFTFGIAGGAFAMFAITSLGCVR